ncbi:hypothetical protein BHE74_00014813 [Ensete ventricosum]|uniref:20 kDa chaperonin, chloroplastic n=1 Tax=Ensete ventricosum TaxID=4639 RepID=A0A444G204_ENSVE|nr:hypothetical protein GW17_00006613 [Ensete ventricosum]RWW77049.1 hypothetical protein BHE74_00014813 [Ensete ventricosum]RZR71617.1 hypothetical protein BHM03_00006111 [Ensete ventricosum]
MAHAKFPVSLSDLSLFQGFHAFFWSNVRAKFDAPTIFVIDGPILGFRGVVGTPMASLQLSGPGISAAKRSLPHFDGFCLSSSTFRLSSSVGACAVAVDRRCFRGLVVKASAVVAPKYTSIKPLGDRVLVKINTSEEVTVGGILLPSTAQSRPQAGEVVALGEGRTIGNNKVQVKLLVFCFQVAEAEEKTAGGLLLTEASKEKPSIGTVITVGPGPLDGEGNRKPLTMSPGSTVLYSKYAGNEFKSADGSLYVVLRASDVMAVLS